MLTNMPGGLVGTLMVRLIQGEAEPKRITPLVSIDHVQLAMPSDPKGEARA